MTTYQKKLLLPTSDRFGGSPFAKQKKSRLNKFKLVFGSWCPNRSVEIEL